MNDQPMVALGVANEVRTTNSLWKSETHALGPAAGARRLADLLDSPSPPFEAMPIDQALKAVQRIGHVRVAALAKHAGVFSGHRRIRDLTPRQRAVLAEELRAWAERWPS